MSTLEITKHLQRLERKIDLLNEQRQKPKWVKSTVITAITGWSKDKMLQAREHGYIKFEVREENGKRSFFYDLASLDERMYKQ